MRRFILIIAALTGPALAAQSSGDDEGPSAELARDFYNSYLDSLPDPRVQRRELLEANLLKTLKHLLPKEDPFEGQKVADGLQASSLVYGRVSRSDPFVRGIFKELPQLKEEEFMYIVRFGPYIAFLCYRSDPMKFRVEATPNYMLVKKKDASPNASSTPSGEKEKSTEDHQKNKTP